MWRSISGAAVVLLMCSAGVGFALRRATLFIDGFESGTIAAWSSVVP